MACVDAIHPFHIDAPQWGGLDDFRLATIDFMLVCNYPPTHPLTIVLNSDTHTHTSIDTQTIILLHFTGPPVPITARMHSTPQINRDSHIGMCCWNGSVGISGVPPPLSSIPSRILSTHSLRGGACLRRKPIESRRLFPLFFIFCIFLQRSYRFYRDFSDYFSDFWSELLCILFTWCRRRSI